MNLNFENAGLVHTGQGSTFNINQNFQSNQPVAHALTVAPFRSEIFVGRVADLEAIRAHFFLGEKILLLVNGQGGIGKTTLASEYYRRSATQYAHIAWVDCQFGIVTALLKALALPLRLAFDPQMMEIDRFNIVQTALINLKAPSLLVLDNANDLHELEQNYRFLGQCPNFHLLVTTRVTALEQLPTYRLEGLPLQEAMELFQKYYPMLPAHERPLLEKIYEAVGGNTLVLEVLAKHLRVFNQLKTQYGLAAVVSNWGEKGLFGWSQSQKISVLYAAEAGLRKEKPETIIAALYDLSHLTENEVHLLSVFSVLPSAALGFEWLEPLCYDIEDLENNILNLAQKGWFDFEETEKTFKCHPVVQLIVRAKNPQLREHCQTMIDVLIEKLNSDTLHEENYKYSTVYVAFAVAVAKIFSVPEELIAILNERIGNFYRDIGKLDRAFRFYEACLKLNQLLCQIEPSNESYKHDLAMSYERFGNVHTDLGNLEVALKFYGSARDIMESLCQSNPSDKQYKHGLAISYERLGDINTHLGNLENSLQFYETERVLMESLCQSDASNEDYTKRLAISYERLGNTYGDLGKLDDALQFYQNEWVLLESLCENYPLKLDHKTGLESLYVRLGDAYLDLGNLDKSLRFYEDSLKLSQLFYENYPSNPAYKYSLAISSSKVGDAHAALNHWAKVLPFYESFYQLSKSLYESYPLNVHFKNGLVVSYWKLGDFHRNLKNNQQAHFYFKQAEALLLELVRHAPAYAEYQGNLKEVQADLQNLNCD